MSNLSDLLPAGASGKTIEATATATIASKAPVILNSAGTVTQVAGADASMGTEGAAPGSARSGWEAGACYHASEGVVVVSFNNAWTYYPSCAVATTSGTTVTLSTPLVLKSSGASLNVCEYDSTQDRVVFHYITTGATAFGYVVAASLSGTTFTLGSELPTFSGDDHGTGAMANLAASKMIIVNGFTNSVITVSKAQVVSISASVVTLGTALQISPATCYQPRVASGKVDEFLCQLGQAVITTMEFVAGTVSGTTITAGVITQLTGGTSSHNDLASGYWNGHTSPESTYMMAYHPPGAAANSQVARIVTVSGTTLTLNATTAIEDVSGNTPAMGWGNSATQALYFFRDGGSGWVTELTYSGTTVTKGTTTEVGAGRYSNNSIVWDQTSNKAVLFYSNASDSDYATANCFTPGSTNVASFVGIADAGISTSATGTIVVQGGTVTGANAILPQTTTFGSESVFESATTTYVSAIFDSDSNRAVVTYQDNGNSNYGTAVVGTVSGTSISWGTPVVFEAAHTEWTSATFDSDSNQVVIAYKDAANSGYGTAIVGTVSGTSISYGTAVVFESADTREISATFDSDSNKVVIAYSDWGNSDYGTGIVGTVSGTSISFGTAVVFESATVAHTSATFDSNENKVVISYTDSGNSDYGTSIVGTVSGTSISFGTAVVFNAFEAVEIASTYDSTAQKVVISYMDGGSTPSNQGTAIVGTVSGTTISFGTEVIFNAASSNYMGMTYDANANQVVIGYQETSKGYLILGTTSGTSISFGTPVVFNNIDTAYISPVYNSTDNKIVIAYKDTGNSNYGTGIVGTIGDGTFTIGSKYYVQDDGTITTVSSSVNAGLAISTTSLLLNGDS